MLLYGIPQSTKNNLKNKLNYLWNNRVYVLIFGLSAVVAFFPQWGYWLAVTGSPIVYSYTTEGFNFLQPKIIQILFFPSRSMFYWFPINFFGFGGLFILWKKRKNWFKGNSAIMQNLNSRLQEARRWNWAIAVVLLLQIYLVSSWWIWTFGGGFGHRALLDFMPLWAIPIACGITFLWHGKHRKLLIIFISLCITFSMVITILAWHSIYIPDRFEATFIPIVKNLIN